MRIYIAFLPADQMDWMLSGRGWYLVTESFDPVSRAHVCGSRVSSDVTCVNYACGCQAKMATRKPLHGSHSFDTESCEGGRELFEACRNGDVTKVRRIVNINSNVNLRDTAGRKSSPLHFAAGKSRTKTNRTALSMSIKLTVFKTKVNGFVTYLRIHLMPC